MQPATTLADASSPPDLSKRWELHQRQQAKTAPAYLCRWCKERRSFADDSRYFDHVRSLHPDLLQGTIDDESHSRRLAELAKKASTRDVRVPSQDDSATAGPSANLPAPASLTRPSEGGERPRSKDLPELKNLSLGHGTDQHQSLVPSTDPPPPSLHRRRRTAGMEAGHLDLTPTLPSSATDPRPSPRRSRARSGGLSLDSSTAGMSHDAADFKRDPIAPDDGLQNVRPQAGPKRLFNPAKDSPVYRSSLDASNVASNNIPPRPYDGRAHGHKARRESSRRKDMRSSRDSQPNHSSRHAIPPQGVRLPTPDPLPPSSAPHDSPPSGSFDEAGHTMSKQPNTRPISTAQLVAEVKGIYAGLVMVEAKCIEVDNRQNALAQSSGQPPRLNNEQWQALIALHRTLLHEHHDFFLASQHPSAGDALRALATKYSMPARMWRHGIHSFLELLRRRLPDSLDHMLAFIYLAYSMVALLYETVSAFENTWIECLGDLGRYRMAIEDDDIRDREIWTGVARFWYSKAADKSCTTGRLYHHLAILARPYALKQLFFYSKSLTVVQPFASARESILTLFQPILESHHRSSAVETAFLKAHGLLFTEVETDRFNEVLDHFLALLDNQIGKVTAKWKEQGVYIAVANHAAMLGFGSADNLLVQHLRKRQTPTDDEAAVSEVDGANSGLGMTPQVSGSSQAQDGVATPSSSGAATEDQAGAVEASEPSETKKGSCPTSSVNATQMSIRTLDLVLQRIGDPNVLPHVHVSLVFLYHLDASDPMIKSLVDQFPLGAMAKLLNTLVRTYKTHSRIEQASFPVPEKGLGRPLTEDYTLRGLIWAVGYFPEEWFSNASVDDEERSLELASMADDRKERILWLAYRISTVSEVGKDWLDREADQIALGLASI